MKTTSSKVSAISDKQIVNDLAGKVFSASRARMPIIIAFFYYILKFFLSVFAFIPRIFLRSKLGERTYGFITVFSVYILFSFTQLTSNVISANWAEIQSYAEATDQARVYDSFMLFVISLLGGNNELYEIGIAGSVLLYGEEINNYQGLSNGLKYCWWIVLILFIIHFIEYMIRKNKEEVIHSFYRGNSIFFSFLSGKRMMDFKIKDVHVWMLIEPLFFFLIAVLIGEAFGFNNLSLVLKFSAICLFFEEYFVFLENRSMALDIVDSLIDGKKLSLVQEKYSQKIALQEDQSTTEETSLNIASIT